MPTKASAKAAPGTQRDDPGVEGFSFGPPAASASACVLVHGFSGSPWDLQPLADALAARGFSGTAPLLPGHGADGRQMRGATFEDWIWGAEQALQNQALRSGGPVYLAGFSMGALVSTVLAARRPTQVKALVLMAPAARLQGLALAVARRLRHWSRPFAMLPPLPKGPPDLEDLALRTAVPRSTHVPAPSLRQLFLLQDLAWQLAPSVQAPAALITAANDHVVDARAAQALYRRMPHLGPHTVLPAGFHGLARDRSRVLLADTVTQFFSQHS